MLQVGAAFLLLPMQTGRPAFFLSWRKTSILSSAMMSVMERRDAPQGLLKSMKPWSAQQRQDSCQSWQSMPLTGSIKPLMEQAAGYLSSALETILPGQAAGKRPLCEVQQAAEKLLCLFHDRTDGKDCHDEAAEGASHPSESQVDKRGPLWQDGQYPEHTGLGTSCCSAMTF